MALREVKPLDENQWAKVQSMLAKGPTDKSINTVKNALERLQQIKH